MKKELGSWGEGVACTYLKQKGYRVLFTNYKTKIGEIDVIVQKDSVIAFIEVKTRRNDRYGSPREAVNYKKQLIYRMVAEQFLQNHNIGDKSLRFDVIEVYKNEPSYRIEHIEDAFGV